MIKNFTQKIIFLSLFWIYASSVYSQPDAASLAKINIDELKPEDYLPLLISINKAIDLDTTNADLYIQRAKINFFLGKYNNTIEDCYRLQRLEPNTPQVYYLRGQVCQATESYGGAILFFTKTITYSTDNDLLFKSYLNRGLVHKILGKSDKAIEDFVKASEINPNSEQVMFPMIETYIELNETAKAHEILSRLQNLDGENVIIFKLMGKISLKKKDFAEAISAFTMYCEINQEDPEGFSLLASTYVEVKNYKEAIVAINRSLAINPNDPLFYKVKGYILLETGEGEKGCDLIFQALQMGYLEKYGYDILDYYMGKCEIE